MQANEPLLLGRRPTLLLLLSIASPIQPVLAKGRASRRQIATADGEFVIVNGWVVPTKLLVKQ
jgi:hypothetical protein